MNPVPHRITALLLVGVAALTACNDTTSPAQQGVDGAFSQLYAAQEVAGAGGTGSSLGSATQVSFARARGCQIDETLTFVCPLFAVGSISAQLRYQLFDAADALLDHYDAAVFDAIRVTSDLSGGVVIVRNDTSYPGSLAIHQDATLRGMSVDYRKFDATGTATVSYTDGGTPHTTVTTATVHEVVLIPGEAYPRSGDVTTDIAESDTTKHITWSFNGTARTIATEVATPGGTRNCIVYVDSPGRAFLCGPYF